jgi:hypothetical protein
VAGDSLQKNFWPKSGSSYSTDLMPKYPKTVFASVVISIVGMCKSGVSSSYSFIRSSLSVP